MGYGIILSAFLCDSHWLGSVNLVWQMANNWFWSQLTVRSPLLTPLAFFT